MINVNGLILRNLEEQVLKNQQDIEDFKAGKQTIEEFGIRVFGIVPTPADLPSQGDNYGDAYLVGSETPYNMYIWSRFYNGDPPSRWINIGVFPAPGPAGARGEIGSVITTGQGTNIPDPTRANDYYIDTLTGIMYQSIQTNQGPKWNSGFSIRGPIGPIGPQGKQGIQGPQGKQGNVGPIGPQGIQGERGPVGPAFNIQATLASTSQLPIPTAEMQDEGFGYLIPDTEGTKHVWIIQGAQNVGPFIWVDAGVAGVGVKGDPGADGLGLNTLTDTNLTLGDTTVQYDTTDGIQINSTMRQTFNNETNHDSMIDFAIPIVAGEGIIIDKAAQGEHIEIKAERGKLYRHFIKISSDSSHTSNEYVNLAIISESSEALTAISQIGPLLSPSKIIEYPVTGKIYDSVGLSGYTGDLLVNLINYNPTSRILKASGFYFIKTSSDGDPFAAAINSTVIDLSSWRYIDDTVVELQ